MFEDGTAALEDHLPEAQPPAQAILALILLAVGNLHGLVPRIGTMSQLLSGFRHPLPLRGGERTGEGAVSIAWRFMKSGLLCRSHIMLSVSGRWRHATGRGGMPS